MASIQKFMGVEIDDVEVVMAVLNGLSDEFGYIIMVLHVLGEESLSIDFFKWEYFEEEQRNLLRKSTSSTDSIPFRTNAETNNNQTRHKCTSCKRKRHNVNRSWKSVRIFAKPISSTWKMKLNKNRTRY